MIKIIFLNDNVTQNHAVIERLWELISITVAKKFRLKVVPCYSKKDIQTALKKYTKDRTIAGLLVAEGIKNQVADIMQAGQEPVGTVIPTVYYRNDQGEFLGTYTQALAIQKALEASCNLYKQQRILIISTEGAGVALAHHTKDELHKATYMYDPTLRHTSTQQQEGIHYVQTLHELAEHRYDIIINATPLGRYYFDRRVEAFTSPLDLETLRSISYAHTIVQETNYVPATTLLLQMAHHLQLPVATGELVLVFEALENVKRIFKTVLDESTVHMLREEMKVFIAELEATILEQ